jgi:hypothetical protein
MVQEGFESALDVSLREDLVVFLLLVGDCHPSWKVVHHGQEGLDGAAVQALYDELR